MVVRLRVIRWEQLPQMESHLKLAFAQLQLQLKLESELGLKLLMVFRW